MSGSGNSASGNTGMNYVYMDVKIGMGHTTPSAKLHVVGTDLESESERLKRELKQSNIKISVGLETFKTDSTTLSF